MAPTVVDAATIEDQTYEKIDEFLQLASEFNRVDVAAARQKKADYYDKIFNNI